MKLFAIFTYPTYYNVFDHTVLAIRDIEMIDGPHTYCLLKPRNIHINFKIYLAPTVVGKGDGIVLKIESDFTGFASVAFVRIPDKPCILQNAP